MHASPLHVIIQQNASHTYTETTLSDELEDGFYDDYMLSDLHEVSDFWTCLAMFSAIYNVSITVHPSHTPYAMALLLLA